MPAGTLLILWTARAAFILWAAAVFVRKLNKSQRAGFLWTRGFTVYLIHVFAAFHFRHGWSHAAAHEETALQTAALFGMQSGAGLYWNYVFTALWGADVLWMYWRPVSYENRSRWIALSIHGYMAFLFFNATVVFAPGWMRWFSLMVFLALAVQLWRRRSFKRESRAAFRAE